VEIGSRRQVEGLSCDITFLSMSCQPRKITPQCLGMVGQGTYHQTSHQVWISSLTFVTLSLNYAENLSHLDVEESSQACRIYQAVNGREVHSQIILVISDQVRNLSPSGISNCLVRYAKLLSQNIIVDLQL
jgi:hypothetical protein